MELDLGPEIEQFRVASCGLDSGARAAKALAAALVDWGAAMTTGGYRAPGLAEALAHPAYADWERAPRRRPGSSARSGRRSSAVRAWTRCGSRC